MKQVLSSCCCFGLRFFERVVGGVVVNVCVFVALSASAAAIAQPGCSKSLVTPPRNKRLEGGNGNLKVVETGLKESVDAFRPLGDMRVNGTDFSENRRTKDATSGGSATTINGAVAKPSNKASGEDAASYWPKIGKKEIYEVLQGALVGGGAMAFMLWMLGIYEASPKKPNVV